MQPSGMGCKAAGCGGGSAGPGPGGGAGGSAFGVWGGLLLTGGRDAVSVTDSFGATDFSGSTGGGADSLGRPNIPRNWRAVEKAFANPEAWTEGVGVVAPAGGGGGAGMGSVEGRTEGLAAGAEGAGLEGRGPGASEWD